MEVVVGFWAVCVLLTCLVARRKKRSLILWGFVAMFLGPIALLIVMVSQTVHQPEPASYDPVGIVLAVGDSVPGLRARIEIRDTALSIRRDEGGQNLLVHGMKGDKTIPFRSITAVQLRMPGKKTNGYIQFAILGGIEGKGGIFEAAGDENSVLFSPAQARHMAALREYIEQKISSDMAPSSRDTITDLARLAELRDRGALTEAEFMAQKGKLLSS